MQGSLLSTSVLAGHLTLMTWIDFRYQVIPNILNASLATCGFAVSAVMFNKSPWQVAQVAAATLLGFIAIEELYRLIRGRTGIGAGDIKFLGAAATWVGLPCIPWVVLLASISGLLAALLSSVVGQDVRAESRIAFGPHLSLGLMLVWLLRDSIMLEIAQ